MHSCQVLLVHHGFQILWGQGQGFGMTVVQHGVLRNPENLKGKVTEQLSHFSVTSASSGALAWELLEKRNFQFDLVLTDVVLPCLSGLDLLSKIKSYEACKQIPVVMMSTHDSLDTVFNCLSKEAADFLVKPVRKNELKNLWQHVWRRCISSSIGGSRIGTGKEDIPKSHVGSDNNVTGSNGDSENISSGLNVQGGSDNGSGNQVHVQCVVQRKHHPHTEAVDGDDEGQATSQAKSTSGTDQVMGQDLEMATPRPASGYVEKSQQPARGANRNEESTPAMEEMEVDNCKEKCNELQEGEWSNSGADDSADKTSQRAIDLIGSIASQQPAAFVEQPGNGIEMMDWRGSNSQKILDNQPSESYSPPTLNLSLKRPRARGEMDTDADDQRMLRHSGNSAFSRYSTNGTGLHQHQHTPGGTLPPAYQMAGSYGTHGVSRDLASSASGPLQAYIPHDQAGSSKGSGEVSTHLKMHVQPIHSGNGQETNSSAMGPMMKNGASGSSMLVPSMQNVKCRGDYAGAPMSYEDIPAAYRPTLQTMYYAHPGGTNTWGAAGPSPNLAEDGENFNHSPALNEHAGLSHLQHPQSQVHFRHSYSEHHFNSQHQMLQVPNPQSQQEKQESTAETGSGAPAFGSSTVLDGKVGNSGSSNAQSSNGNDSMPANVSVSGHNNDNKGCNGMAAGSNGKIGNDENSGSGSGFGAVNIGCVNQGLDEMSGANDLDNHFAIREAALHKFRQKRKERCFEKKVRYQSRKRLAEQRPRVQGQFVRQNVHDLNVSELDYR
ncbi:hypothetical protein BDL97_01G159000 [Sphagnum fallax]|nr:hypothetical protein BDL97_01G159000 [Sphagnum fallax]